MAYKARKVTLTTGAAGTATAQLGLGAKYGYINSFEFKGDDANVDTNNTLTVVDGGGRIIVAATAFDGGTDDSTAKKTNQDFSTVGVYRKLVDDETPATFLMANGVTPTDNVGGAGTGVFAESPLTVSLASGTSGDVHQVVLHVEV